MSKDEKEQAAGSAAAPNGSVISQMEHNQLIHDKKMDHLFTR